LPEQEQETKTPIVLHPELTSIGGVDDFTHQVWRDVRLATVKSQAAIDFTVEYVIMVL